jgi:hypothetical protein
LPAVTRDGKLAIVVVSGGDSGRGYPNVHLEMRDRGDHLVGSIGVVDANDWERLAPDGTPGPELTAHVGAVNRELGGFDLVGTHPAEIQRSDIEAADRAKGKVDDLELEWGPSLEIRGPRARKLIDASSWRAAPQTAGGQPCDNRAYLRGLYNALDARLAIVDVAFHGTDLCWEPADQWHVVTY